MKSPSNHHQIPITSALYQSPIPIITILIPFPLYLLNFNRPPMVTMVKTPGHVPGLHEAPQVDRGLVLKILGKLPQIHGWIMGKLWWSPWVFARNWGVFAEHFRTHCELFVKLWGKRMKKTSFWSHILRESCEISKRTMPNGCKLQKGRFGAATQVSHTCWALSGLGVFKHEHHLSRKLSQLEIQSTYPTVDDWILRMCPLQRHATGGDCWCIKEVQ